MSTSEVVRRAAAGWDEAGVRWALLRGRATMDDASDVDLLVHREDLADFERAVRRLGGVAYPRWAHPWHRRFLLDEVELDVVTELRYHRPRPVSSGLEDGCLDRRTRDGWLWELSPTDTFWTVLLHCLLDKEKVSDRRAAELSAAVPLLDRPSPGEDFLAGLLPPSWSADRVVESVRLGEWRDLEQLAPHLAPGPRRWRSWSRFTGFSRAAAAHVTMLGSGLVARTGRIDERRTR